VSAATLHLIVKGKVQGVGFRWHVAGHARRLGLTGWVKNRSDCAVEICAAGAPEQLAKLEAEVVRGPEGATVTEVERLGEPDDSELPKPFSIVRER